MLWQTPPRAGRGDRSVQPAHGVSGGGTLRPGARRPGGPVEREPCQGVLVRGLQARGIRRVRRPRARRRRGAVPLGDRASVSPRDDHHVGADEAHGAHQPAGDRPGAGSSGGCSNARAGAGEGPLLQGADRRLPGPGRRPTHFGATDAGLCARVLGGGRGTHRGRPQGRGGHRCRLPLRRRRGHCPTRTVSARRPRPRALSRTAAWRCSRRGRRAADRRRLDQPSQRDDAPDRLARRWGRARAPRHLETARHLAVRGGPGDRAQGLHGRGRRRRAPSASATSWPTSSPLGEAEAVARLGGRS